MRLRRMALVLVLALVSVLGCAADIGPDDVTTLDEGDDALNGTQTFTGSVSATGTSWIAHAFDVTAPAQISATLSWTNAAADLNMFLRDPSGTGVAQATTTSQPETLSFNATTSGRWSIGVKARSGSSSYTLTVRVSSSLKPTCRGLMTRAGMPDSTTAYVDAAVAHVEWRALESSDQVFDGPGWAAIDRMVSAGYATRIRVYAGISSPDFVKRLGHTPVSAGGIDCSRTGGIAVVNPQSGIAQCSSFFWTAPALDEYEELMAEVARRYEGAPEVREVVDSACMTVYAEPFFRAHGDFGSNQRLANAGLNLAVDRACHERAIRIHERYFPRTRTALAINSWDVIDPTDSDYHRVSWPEAHAFADWARSVMGSRLVLQNNGLGESDDCGAGTSVDTSVYCYLGSIAGPKGFQTETWERLGGATGLYDALDNALSMGANFVELPGGFKDANQSTLADYDRRLQATP